MKVQLTFCVICKTTVDTGVPSSTLTAMGSSSFNQVNISRSDSIHTMPGKIVHQECCCKYCNPAKQEEPMYICMTCMQQMQSTARLAVLISAHKKMSIALFATEDFKRPSHLKFCLHVGCRHKLHNQYLPVFGS